MMMMDQVVPLWDRFQRYFWTSSETGLSIDVSRVRFPEGYIESMASAFSAAAGATAAMEAGPSLTSVRIGWLGIFGCERQPSHPLLKSLWKLSKLSLQ